MKNTEDNLIAIKSKKFAVEILRLNKILIAQKEYQISDQIIRSGTSIGANVKEALRAQSKADFISKISISLKEASETEYWLELLFEVDIISKEIFDRLISDCRELIKILTKIIKTAKENS